MTTRRLIAIRHGDVAYFDNEGTPLDPWSAALTPLGRQQIRGVAEALSQSGVDQIVTSAVPRARESAEIVSELLGLGISVDDSFNELSPGDLGQVADTDLERTVLHAYRDAKVADARFFGGEAFAAFAARVERGLDRLFDDRCWRTALIVTHDPVNRYLIASSLGLGLAGLRFFEQDASCVNIIDFVDDADSAVEPIVRLVNGTAGDLTRSTSREPALARFYRNYLASRRAR